MSFLVPIRSSLPLDGGGKYKKGNLGRRNTADWLVRFHQIVHHLFFSPSSLVFLMAADSSPPPFPPTNRKYTCALCNIQEAGWIHTGAVYPTKRQIRRNQKEKPKKKNEENFLLLKCERCRLFSLFAFRIFYDLLRTTPCRSKINDAKGGKDSSTLEKKKKKYRKNAKKDVGSTRFHGSSSYITPFLLLFYFKFRPSTYFTSIENLFFFLNVADNGTMTTSSRPE